MALFPTPNLYQATIWANMKIGILGGSFNPAHSGHRHISLMAMKKLNLDAIWWMISPQNPLKSPDETSPLSERLATAKTIANHPRIIPCTLETIFKSQYTADILPKIIKHFPKTHFVWLMGMDNLHNIDQWQNWKDIFHSMPIAVLNRPPHDDGVQNCIAVQTFKKYQISETHAASLCHKSAPSWCILHIPLNQQSSTRIRSMKTPNKFP